MWVAALGPDELDEDPEESDDEGPDEDDGPIDADVPVEDPDEDDVPVEGELVVIDDESGVVGPGEIDASIDAGSVVAELAVSAVIGGVPAVVSVPVSAAVVGPGRPETTSRANESAWDSRLSVAGATPPRWDCIVCATSCANSSGVGAPAPNKMSCPIVTASPPAAAVDARVSGSSWR